MSNKKTEPTYFTSDLPWFSEINEALKYNYFKPQNKMYAEIHFNYSNSEGVMEKRRLVPTNTQGTQIRGIDQDRGSYRCFSTSKIQELEVIYHEE